jgi:hypothetical protein
MRFNLFAIVIAEASTLLPACGLIIGTYRYLTNPTPNYTISTFGMIIIVLFAIFFISGWILSTFCVIPSFRIVLNDNSITKIMEINLFGKRLYESNGKFLWQDISEIKWVYMGYSSGYHIIGKEIGGRNTFLSLSFLMTKRKEALRFAVEHLPKSKVSEKLLKKLGYID